MIPESSQFRLLSGTGTLSYHLEGSSEAKSLHGNIDLNVTSGSARYRNFVMRVDSISGHGSARRHPGR
jgi:hypothetical protein